jgi:hypothetical protein
MDFQIVFTVLLFFLVIFLVYIWLQVAKLYKLEEANEKMNKNILEMMKLQTRAITCLQKEVVDIDNHIGKEIVYLEKAEEGSEGG